MIIRSAWTCIINPLNFTCFLQTALTGCVFGVCCKSLESSAEQQHLRGETNSNTVTACTSAKLNSINLTLRMLAVFWISMVKGVNLELNDIVGILTYPCITAFYSPGC